MSLKVIGSKLVDFRSQGKDFELMRTMYAFDIVSVEANGRETAGRAPVIQKAERWQAANTVNHRVVRGPFISGLNQFAAHFTLDVTRHATGKRETLEEVAIYTVRDDKIAREQFFCEGER